MDGYNQLKRLFEDGVKYQPNPYEEIGKKLKEFNKTHNMELKISFIFQGFTVYFYARHKRARGDKWVMIASKRMVPTMNKAYKGHIDLKQLTDKNKCEVESFLPEIERLFEEYQ